MEADGRDCGTRLGCYRGLAELDSLATLGAEVMAGADWAQCGRSRASAAPRSLPIDCRQAAVWARGRAVGAERTLTAPMEVRGRA